MASLVRLISLLTVIVLLHPGLAAQDKKNDDAKKEEVKKDDAKKAEAKKGEAKDKKDTAKTDEDKSKKKETKAEEKLVYKEKVKGKLKKFENNPARDFTLEIVIPDPQKAARVEQWKAQDWLNILNDGNIANRPNRIVQHNAEYARKKATETFSTKDIEMRMSSNCRFRSLFPPVEYDDKGKLKKWTTRQLDALRGNSKLPGYPSDYDSLKPEQSVEVYLAKSFAPAAKGKKKSDDDDLFVSRPEAVLIVIIQEVPSK